MNRQALDDMVALTDALYRAELAAIHKLTAQETRLREALSRLDCDSRTNASLPAPDLHVARAVGADTLWQAWVARTRRDMQNQLALLLARKAHLMRGLRRAHGRKSAARSLLDDDVTRAQKTRQDRQIMQEQSLFLLKAAGQGRTR